MNKAIALAAIFLMSLPNLAFAEEPSSGLGVKARRTLIGAGIGAYVGYTAGFVGGGIAGLIVGRGNIDKIFASANTGSIMGSAIGAVAFGIVGSVAAEPAEFATQGQLDALNNNEKMPEDLLAAMPPTTAVSLEEQEIAN